MKTKMMTQLTSTIIFNKHQIKITHNQRSSILQIQIHIFQTLTIQHLLR